LVGKPQKKRLFRDLAVDGRMILNGILGLAWTQQISVGLQGPMTGFTEHGSEMQSNLKSFLDQVSNCKVEDSRILGCSAV
jgi:hypothetical protein